MAEAPRGAIEGQSVQAKKETPSVKDLLAKAKEDGIVSKEELLNIEAKHGKEIAETISATASEVKKLSKTMLTDGVTLKSEKDIDDVLAKLIKLSFGNNVPQELQDSFADFNEGGKLQKELKKALDSQQKGLAEVKSELAKKQAEIRTTQAEIDKLLICKPETGAEKIKNGEKQLALEDKMTGLKKDETSISSNLNKLTRGITVTVETSGPRDKYEIKIHDGGMFDGNIQSNDDMVITDEKKAEATLKAQKESKPVETQKEVPKTPAETPESKAKAEIEKNGGKEVVAQVEALKGKEITMEKMGEILNNLSKNPAFGKLFSMIMDLIRAFNPDFGKTEVGQVMNDIDTVGKEGKFSADKQGKLYSELAKNPLTDVEITTQSKGDVKIKEKLEGERKTLIKNQTVNVDNTLNLIGKSDSNKTAKFEIKGNKVVNGSETIIDEKAFSVISKILKYGENSTKKEEDINKIILEKLGVKQDTPAASPAAAPKKAPEEKVAPAAAPKKAPEATKESTTYTVEKGDTLTKIAKEVYGLKSQKEISEFIKTVAAENKINPNKIRVGKELNVPAKYDNSSKD